MFRTRWIGVDDWQRAGCPPLAPQLARVPAIGVRGAIDIDTAKRWADATLADESLLVRDFGGEQLALGRAFYTHLETGAASTYFRDVAASDALVERVLPGMQQRVLDLFASMLGARVRRRAGFAGPGVHVF